MTTEKWQLYSQTGVDGPEYGVRIRTGYTVVGFQKEDAQAIVAWQNASIQPEGDIMEKAKALRNAALPRQTYSIPGQTGYGNPSLSKGWDFSAVDELVRVVVLELIAEVERLRSALAHELDLRNRHIESLEARIKELETDRRALMSNNVMTDYVERLEAAFLDSLAARLYYEHYPGVSDAYSWHDYPEDACHCMPKEKFREKAREALERIKAETGSGDHVAGANKLILTAEQREALEHVIEYVQETQMPISNLNEFDMQELRSLLTGSKPAWEVTEERIAAMKDACNFLVYAEIRNKGVNPGSVDRAKNAEDVLRSMLAGGKRDA